MISNVLNTTTFGSSEVAVRINSVDTEKLASEDITTFMQGMSIPTTILVPKVEHVRHLEWVGTGTQDWGRGAGRTATPLPFARRGRGAKVPFKYKGYYIRH